MNRYRISLLFAAVVIIMPIVTGGGIGQATAQTETATSGSIIDLENEEVNIQLQAQQRTVEHGEPVILTLSAASYVTNSNPITVQLITESPSGVSVTSSTAEQGSGNQFSTVTTVEPGASESLRVVVDPNEPGTYEITSEIVYFVGDNQEASNGERASISVTQNPPARGILWWTPTLVGLIGSGVIGTWLFQPPTASKIKKQGREFPFLSSLAAVGIGSVSVIFAEIWFAQYIEGSGPGLWMIVVLLGTMWTFFTMGDEKLTDTIRLGYAYITFVSILSVFIHICVSAIINTIGLLNVQ